MNNIEHIIAFCGAEGSGKSTSVSFISRPKHIRTNRDYISPLLELKNKFPEFLSNLWNFLINPEVKEFFSVHTYQILHTSFPPANSLIYERKEYFLNFLDQNQQYMPKPSSLTNPIVDMRQPGQYDDLRLKSKFILLHLINRIDGLLNMWSKYLDRLDMEKLFFVHRMYEQVSVSKTETLLAIIPNYDRYDDLIKETIINIVNNLSGLTLPEYVPITIDYENRSITFLDLQDGQNLTINNSTISTKYYPLDFADPLKRLIHSICDVTPNIIYGEGTPEQRLARDKMIVCKYAGKDSTTRDLLRIIALEFRNNITGYFWANLLKIRTIELSKNQITRFSIGDLRFEEDFNIVLSFPRNTICQVYRQDSDLVYDEEKKKVHYSVWCFLLFLNDNAVRIKNDSTIVELQEKILQILPGKI